MAKFAAQTKVPAQQTRADIETLLSSKKATAIGVFTNPDQAVIVFEMQTRRITSAYKGETMQPLLPPPPKKG